MRKLLIGALLLATAVSVAGCTQYPLSGKPSAANKSKSSATSTTQNSATAVEHKTMKPITPANGSESKFTKPEGTKPEPKK